MIFKLRSTKNSQLYHHPSCFPQFSEILNLFLQRSLSLLNLLFQGFITRKSFLYPGAMNATLQTIMAVGINERLGVIQAVIIAAAKEEKSEREQRRFMLKQPVVAPC